MTAENPSALIFDSGLGGLTVVSAIQNRLPNIHLTYLADNQYFPYGKRSPIEVIERVVFLIEKAMTRFDPSTIVIACNTASTLTLDRLRNTFSDTQFVGVVPPIKPAGERSVNRSIALLATSVTSSGAYTEDLIEQFASDCTFITITDPRLAMLSEDKLYGRSIDMPLLKQILQPLLTNCDIDTVVLGCTHYPHLVPEMQSLIPRHMEWLNPAPGVAEHLLSLLSSQSSPLSKAIENNPCQTAYFTDPDTPINPIKPVFKHYGFNNTHYFSAN